MIEVNKILMAEKPSVGLSLMEDAGLMQKILPELSLMNEVEVIQNKGHKNNFYHTLEVIDNIAPYTDNLWLRWGALMHDIGKPRTKRCDKEQGLTFHRHEVVGARMIKELFRKLRLPLDHKMKYVQKQVRLHLRPMALVGGDTSDSAIRRLLYDAGEDIDDILLLCEADVTSKNKIRVETYLDNKQKVRDSIETVETNIKHINRQPHIAGDTTMQTLRLHT